MGRNKEGKESKWKPSELVISVITTLSVISFITFAVFLFLSYQELRESIQQERMDYVSEIASQIMNGQHFMEQEYSTRVNEYAELLKYGELTSLEAVRNCLAGERAEQVLLVSGEGDIITLREEAVFMSDRSIIEKIGHHAASINEFASLNNEEDYWLFAANVNHLMLDGVKYEAIVLAIPSNEFRDNLSVSLFDYNGASYIIQKNGSIKIKPSKNEMLFNGYNLFESMLSKGAGQEAIQYLMKEINEEHSGNRLIKIAKKEWLITYYPIGRENALVVTVPLTITAAETYSGLLSTNVFCVLLVIAMSVIGLMFVLHLFLKDQERTRTAMAVAAKSDFFSKMSHDIRTPLNAVIGMEMLAMDHLDDRETALNYLTKSTAAANYLLSIINDVLDMSRIESGKIEIAEHPFDINLILDDIANIVAATAAEKHLQFVYHKSFDSKDYYLGDQVRLKQILMNLLSNAVKFTKSGGTVTLDVSCVSAETEQDVFVIRVSDTGIGMSENYLPNIFTPFIQEKSSYTEQYTGSGLGLAITHDLVTMMGGTIEVESKMNEGSTFVIRLMLRKASHMPVGEKTVEHAGEQPLQYENKKVLLAEDNALNQEITVAILMQKFNMKVEVAENGERAVNRFASSAPNEFSIILMDVKMPVMDGLEAAKQIRSLNRPDAVNIPIIAFSANAFEEDVALSMEAGMNEHISKPINIDTLKSLFMKYL